MPEPATQRLRSWYAANVGYDPVADDPGMTAGDLANICRGYALEAGLPDPTGMAYHLDAGDDGTVGVVNSDTGEVVAVITRAGDATPAAFIAAMRALDPNYDPDEFGHG